MVDKIVYNNSSSVEPAYGLAPLQASAAEKTASSEPVERFYSVDSVEEQAIKTAIQDGVLLPEGSLAPKLMALGLNHIEHPKLTEIAVEFLNHTSVSHHTVGALLVHVRDYAQITSLSDQLGDEFCIIGKQPLAKLPYELIKQWFEQAALVNPHIMKLFHMPEFMQNVLEPAEGFSGRIVSDMNWTTTHQFSREFWGYAGRTIDKYWKDCAKQENGQRLGHILTGVEGMNLTIANKCQSELFDDTELQLVVNLSSLVIDKEGRVCPKSLKVRAVASSGCVLHPICQKGLKLLSIKPGNECNAPGLFNLLSDLSKNKFFLQTELLSKAVAGFFNDRKVKADFVEESVKHLVRVVKRDFAGAENTMVMLALLLEKHLRSNWPAAPHPAHATETLSFWAFWTKVVSCLSPQFYQQPLSLPGIRTFWNAPAEFLQMPYALSSLLQLCVRAPLESLPETPEARLISLGEKAAIKATCPKINQKIVIDFEPNKWLIILSDQKFEKLPQPVWSALLHEALDQAPSMVGKGKSVVECHPELLDSISAPACLALLASGVPYLTFAATTLLFSAYVAGRKEMLSALLLNAIPALLDKGGRLRTVALLMIEKLTGSKDLPQDLPYQQLIFKYFAILTGTGRKEFCQIVLNDLLANPDLASLPEFFGYVKEILPKTGEFFPAETFTLLARMQAYFQADDPTKSTLLKAGLRLLAVSKLIASDIPEFCRHLCQVRNSLAVVPDRAVHVRWLVSLQRKFAPDLAHTMIPMVEKYLEAKGIDESLKRELVGWGQEIKHSELDFELTVLLEKIAAKQLFEVNTPLTKPARKPEPLLSPDQKAEKVLTEAKTSRIRLNIQQTLELIDALPSDSVNRPALAQQLLKNYYNKKQRYFSEEIQPHLLQLTQLLINAQKTGSVLLEAIQTCSIKDFSDVQIDHILKLIQDSLSGKHRQTALLARCLQAKPELVPTDLVQTMIRKILTNNQTPKNTFAQWLGWLQLPVSVKTCRIIWHHCRFLLHDNALVQPLVNQFVELASQQLEQGGKLVAKELVRLLMQQKLTVAQSQNLNAQIAKTFTPQERFGMQMDVIQLRLQTKTLDEVKETQAIIALRKSSAAIYCSDEHNQILLMTLLSLLSGTPTGERVETAIQLSENIRLQVLQPKQRALVIKQLQACREYLQSHEPNQLPLLGRFATFNAESRHFKSSLYEEVFISYLKEQNFTEAASFAVLYLKATKQKSYTEAIPELFQALIKTPTEENKNLAHKLLQRMVRFAESRAENRACCELLFQLPFEEEKRAWQLAAYLSLVQTADAPFLQTIAALLPIKAFKGLEAIWQKIDRNLCRTHAQLVEGVLIHLVTEKTVWTEEEAAKLLLVVINNKDTQLKPYLQPPQENGLSEEEATAWRTLTAENWQRAWNMGNIANLSLTQIRDLLVASQKELSETEWQTIFERATSADKDPQLVESLLDLYQGQVTDMVMQLAFIHGVEKYQKAYCEEDAWLKSDWENTKKVALIALMLPFAINNNYAEVVKRLGAAWMAIDPKNSDIFRFAKQSLERGLSSGLISMVAAPLSWLQAKITTPLALRIAKAFLHLNLSQLPVDQIDDGFIVAGFIATALNHDKIDPQNVSEPEKLLSWLLQQNLNAQVKAQAVVALLIKCHSSSFVSKLRNQLQKIREAILDYATHPETSQVILNGLETGKLEGWLDKGVVDVWVGCLRCRCQALSEDHATPMETRRTFIEQLEKSVLRFAAQAPAIGEMLGKTLFDMVVKHGNYTIVTSTLNKITGVIKKTKKELIKLNFEATSCSMMQGCLFYLIPQLFARFKQLAGAQGSIETYRLICTCAQSCLVQGRVVQLYYPENAATIRQWIEQIFFINPVGLSQHGHQELANCKALLISQCCEHNALYEAADDLLGAYSLFIYGGLNAASFKLADYLLAKATLDKIISTDYPAFVPNLIGIGANAARARRELDGDITVATAW